MVENKHTIYFNMCHHYRKIFNAKPTIDTSPPKALQIKTNSQWNISRNPSPFRTKTPAQEKVKTFQKEPYLTQDNGTITCKYYYQHHNKKEESKNDEKVFNAPNKPFNPRILKTSAQSKLRNLRVYHPPRRKKVEKSTESSPLPQNEDDNDKKDEIIRRPVFNVKSSLKNSKRQQSLVVLNRNSYSEESSEDSAYNEGEGVLSGDSRGSTPQNLSNKHQSAKLIMADNNQSKIINTSINKVNDEVIYIQFLKDITNDILKKNIFTNKALKSVFQHHVQINKYELEMEKMQKEITKLQERLGVPKDDKLDDENYGLGKDSSISEPPKPASDSSRETSISVDHTSEAIPQLEEPIEDEDASKEHEYSEDFSDFDNHSVASEISNNHESSDEHVSYNSEDNDKISSVSDNEEEIEENDRNDDESIAEEENIISRGEEDFESELESEISENS
ncbi:spermatogenesis-associated protein 7 homolog isoform X2 [Planococcus citri]|uniref:spermatogenesis-associated protein 7 homolog isoform X2 n=1 Tax=Planococcus citri TaxID=170843 RepID=UPI0031F78B03